MTERIVLTDPVAEPAERQQVPVLLEQARAAHQRYRDNIPRRVANGTATMVMQGDPLAAGEAMNDACRLLADAHALDPQHTDPAWRPEDDALLTFYAEMLSR